MRAVEAVSATPVVARARAVEAVEAVSATRVVARVQAMETGWSAERAAQTARPSAALAPGPWARAPMPTWE